MAERFAITLDRPVEPFGNRVDSAWVIGCTCLEILLAIYLVVYYALRSVALPGWFNGAVVALGLVLTIYELAESILTGVMLYYFPSLFYKFKPNILLYAYVLVSLGGMITREALLPPAFNTAADIIRWLSHILVTALIIEKGEIISSNLRGNLLRNVYTKDALEIVDDEVILFRRPPSTPLINGLQTHYGLLSFIQSCRVWESQVAVAVSAAVFIMGAYTLSRSTTENQGSLFFLGYLLLTLFYLCIVKIRELRFFSVLMSDVSAIIDCNTTLQVSVAWDENILLVLLIIIAYIFILTIA